MGLSAHVSMATGEYTPSSEIERAQRHREETGDELYGDCCAGAAMFGVDRCTCWEPVYDLEQSEQLEEGPAIARRKRCPDCAFHAGSPERSDEDGEQRLDDAVHGVCSSFWCHQGVRRVVEWRHPDGRVVAAADGDYRPPQGQDRLWLADGRPGEMCAGWWARRQNAELGPSVLHRAKVPEWA
jgi:hypothetical protein